MSSTTQAPTSQTITIEYKGKTLDFNINDVSLSSIQRLIGSDPISHLQRGGQKFVPDSNGKFWSLVAGSGYKVVPPPPNSSAGINPNLPTTSTWGGQRRQSREPISVQQQLGSKRKSRLSIQRPNQPNQPSQTQQTQQNQQNQPHNTTTMTAKAPENVPFWQRTVSQRKPAQATTENQELPQNQHESTQEPAPNHPETQPQQQQVRQKVAPIPPPRRNQSDMPLAGKAWVITKNSANSTTERGTTPNVAATTHRQHPPLPTAPSYHSRLPSKSLSQTNSSDSPQKPLPATSTPPNQPGVWKRHDRNLTSSSSSSGSSSSSPIGSRANSRPKLSLSHERLPIADRSSLGSSPLRATQSSSSLPTAINLSHSPTTNPNASQNQNSSQPFASFIHVGGEDKNKAGGGGGRKKPSQLERAKTQLALIQRDKPAMAAASTNRSEVRALSNCPRWVPDADSLCCTLCGKQFTVLLRRHHCRKCGGLFCGECTNYKLELPELQFKKPVRVCVPCFCQYNESHGESAHALFTGSGIGAQVDKDALHLTSEKPDDDDDDDDDDEIVLGADGKPKSRQTTDLDAVSNKEERLRRKCIREIIETEKAYIEDLGIIQNVFLMPIRITQILTQDQISRLFSNIEMLEPVHRELLQKLTDETLTQNGLFVGQAFNSMSQYFKVYTTYCQNHEIAVQLLEELKLNPEFSKSLAVCHSDTRAKGLNISAYLIKPVQRVCKYPLFLRDLIRYTKEGTADLKCLNEAKEKIDVVVQYINEGKRKFEDQRRIIEIRHNIEGTWEEELVTPTRTLLLESRISGKDLRTQKEHGYVLYIFQELVVIAKIVEGTLETTIHHSPYVLKGFIPVGECKLTVIADTDTVKNSIEIRRINDTLDQTKLPVFQFFLKDEQEKAEIVKLLRGLIKGSQKKKIAASTGIVTNTIPTISMTAKSLPQAPTSPSNRNQQNQNSTSPRVTPSTTPRQPPSVPTRV